MLNDVNIKTMAYFEAVARLGRVARAAEALGVSSSAVSQQIKQLEEQLGVRLFHRERKRLQLTLEGERLFQTTTQALRAIGDVRAAITRQREIRQLSVRVSPSFGVRWLGPRLAEFIKSDVDRHVRFDATPEFTDFATEAIDLDLRYGIGDWWELHAECVVHDLILPLCSPAYLADLRKTAENPFDQLRAARLIDSVKTVYRWDLWLGRHGIGSEQMVYPIRFDRSSMAIQLAISGGGVVLDSVTLAYSELATGALVPLSTCFDVIEFPAYWLVCPSPHLTRRNVQAFVDWIRATGTKYEHQARSLLRGLGCSIRPEPHPVLIAPESTASQT